MTPARTAPDWLHRLRHNPFLRFILTGGIAAAVNVVSRLALSLVFSFQVAVVLAYLIGMTTAYGLARAFVFARSGHSMHREYARFTLVNIVALAQVWGISMGLAYWLFPILGYTFHAELTAHVLGVVSPVFTSYYGHKLFTFRKARQVP